MPPKKKDNNNNASDLGLMRAARFGRVKNTLSMGFGAFYIIIGIGCCCECVHVCVEYGIWLSFASVCVRVRL
jgi:hypothetical protein